MSLKKANEHRNEWFEGVHKCKLDDTLYAIMEKIVRAEVRFFADNLYALHFSKLAFVKTAFACVHV